VELAFRRVKHWSEELARRCVFWWWWVGGCGVGVFTAGLGLFSISKALTSVCNRARLV